MQTDNSIYRRQQQESALLTHLRCFQNDKLIVRRNRRAITKSALQLTEVIEVAVADDVQLAAVFQAAAGIVKHLPGDMVGNSVLLMERRITQNRRKSGRAQCRRASC